MGTRLPFLLPLPWSWRRISLRRLGVDDLAAFQSYRTDPEVARFQGWQIVSDEEARSFIETMHEAPLFVPGEWFQLGIALRETQALIGDIGICVDKEQTRAEIGFTLNPSHQGRGLATEAVDEAIRRIHQFTRVSQVVARPDARNEPCIRLLERLGFERRGESAFSDEDGVQSEIEFAIVREPKLRRRR